MRGYESFSRSRLLASVRESSYDRRHPLVYGQDRVLYDPLEGRFSAYDQFFSEDHIVTPELIEKFPISLAIIDSYIGATFENNLFESKFLEEMKSKYSRNDIISDQNDYQFVLVQMREVCKRRLLEGTSQERDDRLRRDFTPLSDKFNQYDDLFRGNIAVNPEIMRRFPLSFNFIRNYVDLTFGSGSRRSLYLLETIRTIYLIRLFPIKQTINLF